MSKISLKKLSIIYLLIGVFCCGFIFSTVDINGSNNQSLISTFNPKDSTAEGSSDPIGDEWPMFHRSLNHSGFTETTPIRGSSPIWNYTTGGDIYGDAVITNGMLYIGSYDGNLYCLNATSGGEIWVFATHSAIISTPAVANGRVYVGCADYNVYCLDANLGIMIWTFTTDSVIGSSPAIYDMRVYIGSSDGNLYCLDANSGIKLWNYTTGTIMYSSPAVVNDMVYVGTTDYVTIYSNFFCLNATSGTKIWNYTIDNWITSSPAVVNDMVYIGGFDGNIYCFNATSGEKIWSYMTGGAVHSSPAIAYGMVYVASNDTNLYCLDAISGVKIWNYNIGDMLFSSPAVSNGIVFVGCHDYNFYGFNAFSGKFLGSFSTDSYIEISSPSIAKGLIYIGSFDDRIYCFPFFKGPASVPLNLNLEQSDEQVTLTWDPPSDDGGFSITNYSIYRGNSPGTETYLTSVYAATTSYIDTGVSYGENYYYKISAVNDGGEGPNSTESSITLAVGLTKPLNLQAIPGDKQISLSWDVPSNDGGSAISGYKIYRGYLSGVETLLTTIGNVTTYVDIGLSDGITYYYKVSAINGFGEGPQSVESNATTFGYPIGNEWPMFRRNLNHTGMTETSPIRGNSPIWSYTTDFGVESSPAILNGMLYVGSFDYNIYCLNATTGVKIWNYTTGSMIMSSPAVANGMVYIGSFDSNMYCLNATSGVKIWNYTTGGVVASSPAIENGRVYFGGIDNNTYCLNATTGIKIWNYETGNAVVSSPAVVNGMVYIASYDHSIYCLNANTGVEIWKYTTDFEFGSSPTIANGMVYIGSADNNTYCLNATSGFKIWNYSTNYPIASSPAVAYGMVYIGSYDGNVYCLDAISGAKIWNYTTGGEIGSSPSISNGMMFVGSYDSKIYGLNAYSGKYLGNFTTGASIYLSSPAIANGKIYCGSDDYKVYCLPFFNGPPSAPLNLNLIQSDQQITLTWDPPSDNGGFSIANYSIYRGNSPGTETYLTSVTAPSTFYIDTAVTYGETYYYKISAVNDGGQGPNSTESSITLQMSLTAPQNLHGIPGDQQIFIEWDPPSENGGSPIKNYSIYRGTSSGAESFLTTIGNVTFYMDTGLSYGTTYYYKVSAINNIGEGPQSSETSSTTYGYPTEPINLQAIPGVKHINLSWDPPINNRGSAITGYNVYRGNLPGGETFLATIGNVTNYTDMGLSDDTTYHYKVTAINAFGEGPRSSEVSATTLLPLSAPRNLQAIPGDRQITLNWDVPSSNGGSVIIGYNIYKGTSSGNEVFLEFVYDMTTYLDTGLSISTTYYYKVSAVNSIGEGPKSSEVGATTFGYPSEPINLQATSGLKNIALNWEAPLDNGGSEITIYRIYRGNSSGTEVFLSMTSSTSFLDTSLPDDTIFYYKVSAVNVIGEGANSSEISASTSTYPTEPINLQAIAGVRQITLTWQVPIDNGGQPIYEFRIYRGNSSGTEVYLFPIGNETTYVIPNLSDNTTYYFKVSAVNYVGEGLQSTEASAKTFALPSAPINIKAVSGQNHVNLTWDPPSDNGGSPIKGYMIYRGDASGNERLLGEVSNVTTYSDLDLLDNLTVYYRISAITDVGEGPLSSEVSATTFEASRGIGGMDVGPILLVSFVGVTIVVIMVKKRLK